MTVLVYERIYVAVDGSKEAEFAFEKAVGIAKRNVGSTLHLVHIIDRRSTVMMDYYDSATIEQAKDYAEQLLASYVERAAAVGVEGVEVIIEEGAPKQALIKKFTPLTESDLVICGATGLNRVERFLIGSVSDNIVRSAGCDVLVVRTPERYLEE
ncbi:universal stress protein [Caryophanon tenue]|uniref:Universal stress protein UspA n=1 Tax=Caryophanon tenue TaxID=33978 RepID=A0A1C0Y764_9BACL|nr:universal stress protein [Caryophanon tenue]OCS83002.1 universal stress protein UspA [Caryophanon tenue]